MVSKTGQTQVAKAAKKIINSIGIYIWQYEQIHWQKIPLCIKHAVQVLLSVQTVVG